MSTSTSTSTPLHHQRTPRTPESYFNVPESIALLNIVKSERIQCAFQSNRKNHASVWEMVANILNRYSNRKRSAKQCCNRYENLKKIYTQLKRNPEKHVRRNWPYMYLFREIEEQRGETWGANGKRAAANLLAAATAAVNGITINNNSDNIGFVINSSSNNLDSSGGGGDGVNISGVDGCNTGGSDAISIKNQIKNELTYYQRRRNAAALTNMLMNREVMLTNINNNNNNNSSNNNCNNSNNNNDSSNHERLMANNFVETEINDCDDDNKYCGIDGNGGSGGDVGSDTIVNNGVGNIDLSSFGLDAPPPLKKHRINTEFGLPDFLNNMKDEPISDQESDHDNNRNTFMNNNYNGNQDLYMNGDQNILHPDVIVDTDPVTDSSSLSLGGDHHHNHRNRHNTNKRKRSISTEDDDDDGGESSTNYELIEYLRRREKRDEQMQRKMDEREERLMKLLERTVVAIERIASQSCTHSNNNLNLNNNNNNNTNSNNNNNTNTNTEIITKNQ